MKAPIIAESYFNPEDDCAINSALLRVICDEIMAKRYIYEQDDFVNGRELEWWGIRLIDNHGVTKPGTKEPHYILEIGEGEYRAHTSMSFSTRYRDYESTDEGEIDEAPGTWQITVLVPSEEIAREIAAKVDQTYREVMKNTLGSYYIMSSELMDA